MDEAKLINLSEVISEIRPILHIKYMTQFREAAKAGDIDCVPVETTFSIRDNSNSYRDHVILDDDRFKAWHAQTLRNFELSAVRGALAYAEDLKTGKVDFKARAEEYRKSLKKQRRSHSKPKKDRLAQVITDTDESSAAQVMKAAPKTRAEGKGKSMAAIQEGESEVAVRQHPQVPGGADNETMELPEA